MLAEAGIRLFFNGPESFTPDDRYLLGESPDVPGLFVAAGFNSIGIQSAGGAGKVLADWIIDGRPPMDLWDVDVRRVMPFQRNRAYLRDRTVEALGLLYAMHWPYRQPETARGVRRSPVHDRLAARRACFGETAGWERANWFAPEGVAPSYEYSYGRQNWFEHSAVEHRAVRDNVGLFDLTSFAKFHLEGPDAERVLNRVCANDVSVAVGKIVYTQWLNENGGIEADLTVTRQADDSYMIVTAAATQTRDFHWLKDHIGPDDRAIVVDVSAGLAVFSVMGPSSRRFLQPLTPTDLSNDAFPFGTSQVIDLGYARVRASRITYVGELGWELHVPVEFAATVYAAIMSAGAAQGIANAGYRAIETLRLEKGYRAWGADIGPDHTPFEAGLGWAVKLKTAQPFMGRTALEQRAGAALKKWLCTFTVDDPAVVLLGRETIYRDGERVGWLGSGGYGHTLKTSIGLGYVRRPEGVTREYLLAGSYELEVATERVPCTLHLGALYDAAMARIKA